MSQSRGPADHNIGAHSSPLLSLSLSHSHTHTHNSGCRFPQVQFEYQDPTPRFDHSKVKGPVAKLIRVKDIGTATALEVTAGSKVTITHMIPYN